MIVRDRLSRGPGARLWFGVGGGGRYRPVAAALLIAVVSAWLLPTAADASTASLRLSYSTGATGLKVVLTGAHLPPRARIQVTWDGHFSGLPTARVAANGSVRVSVAIPKGTPGTHRIAAVRVLQSSRTVVTRSSQLGARLAWASFRLIACGSSLQAKINAAAPGSVLDLTGCTYATGATIAKPMTLRRPIIRPARGTRGLLVSADGVTLDGLKVLGPQATTYSEREMGILVTSSTQNPVVDRLTIRNCEIAKLGHGGIWLEHVADTVIQGNRVHDIVYAGIMIVSGTRGRITGNSVRRVGVTGSATHGGNAYGIALTDTGAPATSDFDVSGNTVTDVPTWHALDTHGGQRIAFRNNTVYRAPRELFITTSGVRPTDIVVTGNLFGSPDPVRTNLQAVTTYDALRVEISGNTARGWVPGNFFGDYLSRSEGLVVANNVITP